MTNAIKEPENIQRHKGAGEHPVPQRSRGVTNATKELECWKAGGLCPQAICFIEGGEVRWRESCQPGQRGSATEWDGFPRKCTVVQT